MTRKGQRRVEAGNGVSGASGVTRWEPETRNQRSNQDSRDADEVERVQTALRARGPFSPTSL